MIGGEDFAHITICILSEGVDVALNSLPARMTFFGEDRGQSTWRTASQNENRLMTEVFFILLFIFISILLFLFSFVLAEVALRA